MSVEPKRKKKTEEELKYYVSPKQFRVQIEEYYAGDGKCSPELGDTILKIAQGLAQRFNFINYTYKDEMIGDAILKMYTALERKRFDISSSFNPFSYFTTIAFRSFINRIKKEQKYAQTLEDYKETVYAELLNEELEDVGTIYTRPTKEEDE